MSRLRVFQESDPSTVLFESTDADAITAKLSDLGVGFERWPVRAIDDNASPHEIMRQYKPEIDRLVADNGFQAVDVVSINPDHPERGAMRAKFLNEHSH